jgi:NADP-dependent 3-hydroxy acid dehydrogenase YdfG
MVVQLQAFNGTEIMTIQQVWFITGCSTGFGRALTEAVLEMGPKVVATARKPQRLEDLAPQYGERILVLP